jgi:ABC-type transport system involved in cytochrome c biogenesis permease subunit
VLAQASIVLGWFAFALYVGATVLYAYQFLLRRSQVTWWARFLTGAGFIAQTLSIGARSMATHGTQLTGANQLYLAAWALVLLYFVMEHVIRLKVYGAFLIPVAVVLMTVSRLISGSAAGIALSPAQEQLITGWQTGFHVALIVFANAGFIVGAVSSMLYLLQGRSLKGHRSNVVTRRLPSLATLQTVARRSIALAFPVYTAGLFLGVLRANEQDVNGWWQDPRVMGAGVVWATFGVYLWLTYRHEVSSKTSAWIAILGLVFVVIVAILARTLPVGFHVFGLST